MLIQKCPTCAEFLHAESAGEPMICWNCGAIVPIYGAPTWDQTISDWIDRQFADPESLLPLAVPLALFLVLFFLQVTAQRPTTSQGTTFKPQCCGWSTPGGTSSLDSTPITP